MFYDDLERGKRGEKLVADVLAARGSKVTDLRDDANARWNDIDFLLEKEGKQTTLEVKTDYASERTGNFFIEFENRNNIKHNYSGWIDYCGAEYVCFVQESIRTAYIVLLDELRRNIKENKYRTASGRDACGFLMPVSDVKGLKSCVCLEL